MPRPPISEAVHLVAIHPVDGWVDARWFGDEVDAAEQWALERNLVAGCNVYWTVNVCREGLDRKPAKADIVRVRFAHVDVDPHDGWSREETIRFLSSGRYPADIVIDSGNGVQALWDLSPSPTPPTIDQVEDLNRRLAAACGGDACHNADRLLRVPDTINFPTPTKRARGRKEAWARALRLPEP